MIYCSKAFNCKLTTVCHRGLLFSKIKMYRFTSHCKQNVDLQLLHHKHFSLIYLCMLIRLTVQFCSPKAKIIDRNRLHYLSLGPIVQVLSVSWAESKVVLIAKVNCRPWVTVHFAQGTFVFKYI